MSTAVRLLQAAASGDLPAVQALYPVVETESWDRIAPAELLEVATVSRQLEVVRWLFTSLTGSDVVELASDFLELAIQTGDPAIVTAFRDGGTNDEPSTNDIRMAAEYGSIPLLQATLADWPLDPDKYTMALKTAAQYGHRDLLAWLVDREEPLERQNLGVDVLQQLALKMPRELLQLIRQKNWCIVDTMSVLSARLGGYQWPELLVGLINTMAGTRKENILDISSVAVITQLNIDRGYWATRWLSPRVDHRDLIDLGWQPRPAVDRAIMAGLQAILPVDLVRYIGQAAGSGSVPRTDLETTPRR